MATIYLFFLIFFAGGRWMFPYSSLWASKEGHSAPAHFAQECSTEVQAREDAACKPALAFYGEQFWVGAGVLTESQNF